MHEIVSHPVRFQLASVHRIETKRICRYAFLINNAQKARGKTLGHY